MKSNKNSKIREIWVNSNKISNELEIKELKSKKIQNAINFQTNHVFNKITKYEIDWETLTIDEEEKKIYKEWRIDINRIPKKIIPFIRFAVLYKTNNHDNVGTDVVTNHIYNVIDEDIYGQDFLKIQAIIGFRIDYSGASIPQVDGKLLIYIFNPEDYV